MNTDYKLIETKKKFLFSVFEEENYRLSAKTSLIYVLYQKKLNENNYFRIPDKSNEEEVTEMKFLAENLASFFIIDNRIRLVYTLEKLASYSDSKEFIYLNNQNYFEIPSSFYLRKSLSKEIKNRIDWR